jgi:hypothetical protein
MHAVEVRTTALALVAAGHSDAEVGRRLGVPRRTVRDWRVADARPRPLCHRCWAPTSPVALTSADYAELLGLYLGDGHITDMPRTQRLRIFLDAAYPQVVADASALLARCLPGNRVGVLPRRRTMVVVWTYHQHLSCLLPQHGPGKKHERPIAFEPWQRAHVHAAPWAFLRGCIRSDGCTFINRTGAYTYVSYEFRNRSEGIRGLFAEACDAVGVGYRVNGDRIRICRRPSVALLLEHVGIKA